MPPNRHRKVLTAAAILAAGFSLIIASPAMAAPSLVSGSVSMPSEVEQGEVVDVIVTLTGLTDVFAYELDLTYDDDDLEYVADSTTGPAGGFDETTTTASGLSIVHSRLGSSPALEGNVTITLSFTATGTGDAPLSADALSLVDPDGTTVSLEDVGSDTVTILAAAPEPTATPTVAPTTPPTVTPTDTEDDQANADGDLASTGINSTTLFGMIAAAAFAIIAGVVVMLRRRKVAE